MVVLDVPSEYGYCVLVAIGSQFVLMWKAIQVGRGRVGAVLCSVAEQNIVHLPHNTLMMFFSFTLNNLTIYSSIPRKHNHFADSYDIW